MAQIQLLILVGRPLSFSPSSFEELFRTFAPFTFFLIQYTSRTCFVVILLTLRHSTISSRSFIVAVFIQCPRPPLHSSRALVLGFLRSECPKDTLYWSPQLFVIAPPGESVSSKGSSDEERTGFLIWPDNSQPHEMGFHLSGDGASSPLPKLSLGCIHCSGRPQCHEFLMRSLDQQIVNNAKRSFLIVRHSRPSCTRRR